MQLSLSTELVEGTGVKKLAVKPDYNPSTLGGAGLASYSRKL